LSETANLENTPWEIWQKRRPARQAMHRTSGEEKLKPESRLNSPATIHRTGAASLAPSVLNPATGAGSLGSARDFEPGRSPGAGPILLRAEDRTPRSWPEPSKPERRIIPPEPGSCASGAVPGPGAPWALPPAWAAGWWSAWKPNCTSCNPSGSEK
jgi:hypothetical protein